MASETLISFGIEIATVTPGIKKTQDDLKSINKLVDNLKSNTTTLGKAQFDAALKAAKGSTKNIQTTLDMNKALKDLGVTSGTVFAAVSNALLKFNRDIKGGAASTNEINAAMHRFNTSTAKVASVIKVLKTEEKSLVSTQKTLKSTTINLTNSFGKVSSKGKKSAQQISSFSKNMQNLQSASILAVGPLSRLGAVVSTLGAVSSRSSVKTAVLFGSLIGGVVALTKLSASVIKTSIEIQKITNILKASSGSAQQASKDFDFIAATADRLGLKVLGTAEAFAKFSAATKGSVLEGQATKTIFTELSAASGVLGFSTEKTGQLFRAFEQIVSKGTVQSEELKGQIGEVLPGAFTLFAKSMGKSTEQLSKLLKAGKVKPKELLGFAKIITQQLGIDSSKAVITLIASLNRLDNSTKFFNKRFDEITLLSSGFKNVIDGLTASIRFLTNNLQTIIPIVLSVGAGFIAAGVSILALKVKTALFARFALIAAASTSTLGLDMFRTTKKVTLLAKSLNFLKIGFLSLGKIGIIGVATTLVTLIFSFVDFSNKAKLSKEATKEFKDELKRLAKQTEETGVAMTKFQAITLLPKAAKEFSDLNERIKTVSSSLEKNKKNLKGLKEEAVKAKSVFNGLFGKVTDLFFPTLIEKSTKKVNRLQTELNKLNIERQKLFKDVKPLQIASLGKSESTKKNDIINRTKIDARKKALGEILTLQEKINSLNAGPKQFKLFENQQRTKKELERFKKSISGKNANGTPIFSGKEIDGLVEKFRIVQEKLLPAQKALERQKQLYQDIGKIGEDAFKTIEDGILNVIDGTESLGKVFANVVDGMVRDLTRFFLESAIGGKTSGGGFITSLLTNFITSAVGGGGDITAPLNSSGTSSFNSGGSAVNGSTFFAPGRAVGGKVFKNKRFMVGERGPELFTPSSNGFITPNNKLGSGGGQNVTVTVINNGSKTTAKTKETNNGNQRNIEVIIDDLVASKISNPTSRTSKALRNSLSQGVISR